MITEAVIDGILEKFASSPAKLNNVFKEIASEQPAIISMLYSRDMKMLTEKETDLLFFLVAVIYEAVKSARGMPETVTPEELEKADEENWDKMLNAPKGSFNKRIDGFFEDYPQEDLLAYVEDSVTDGEDQFVTGVGREAIFVTAKTVIDVLTR